MLRLHDNHLSGNGYKARLLLAHLGQTYERIEVDILKGETRTPEFLARNPNGRIPVLELEDGTCLAESNAILFYLAEGSRLSPRRPAGPRPRPPVDVLRAVQPRALHRGRPPLDPAHGDDGSAAAQLPDKQAGGRAALAVMERHLGASEWFGGDAMGIADFALYAYTHVADEGGFDLADYPAVGAWLARVAEQPGHVPMNPAPEGVVHPADR